LCASNDGEAERGDDLGRHALVRVLSHGYVKFMDL
jgi:hypothetical protein